MASRTAALELVAEEFREWILKFPGNAPDLILSFFALVSGDVPEFRGRGIASYSGGQECVSQQLIFNVFLHLHERRPEPDFAPENIIKI